MQFYRLLASIKFMPWVLLMGTPLIAQNLGPALTTPEMSEDERFKKLASYFSPAPGEKVEIDPSEILNRGKTSPLKLRGYIRVTPPKGRCFILFRQNRQEEHICAEATLAFKAEELDEGGRLAWEIISGKGDIGTTLWWQTPHRLANVIPIGQDPKKMTELSDKIPIQYCTAQQNLENKTRKIVLQIMDGTTWFINFPETDTLLQPQPEPYPNLYMARRGSGGGISKESKVEERTKGYKVDVTEGKPGDPVITHWAVPARNSFVLNAADFVTESSPAGMKGYCRYQLSGAPHDSDSGWIECHETDRFDVVYAHLSCASQLLAKPPKKT